MEVNLDWDNFSMDLVMQVATRAMCDEIKVEQCTLTYQTHVDSAWN